MDKSIVKRCYLCGATGFNNRHEGVRDNPDIDVLECSECGLVFLSSIDHIQDGFYEESGMHEEPLDVKAWQRETARDDERRFDYLKELLPNRSALDFGCGTGGFLERAQKLAVIAKGIEPDSGLTEYFKKQGLSVWPSLQELIEGDERKYDIVTMFHVMEHLPDPKAVLHQLAGLLPDKGQIIIEVPSSADALLSLYGCMKFARFSYWSCHLYLFNSSTISRLAQQLGMKVNYIKQVQRYSLANHLYWLARGKKGGHAQWNFLESAEMNAAYEKQLASLGLCDTIIASFSNPE